MPRVADIERMSLTGPKGRVAGSIEHVLFHPTEPRVVGLQVRPNRFLFVIERKPVFVPLSNVVFAEDGTVRAELKKPHTPRGQDFEWAVTVVWRGMPVRDESGTVLGAVHDAGFTKKSGRVTWIELSEGAVSDAAVGRRRLPGEAAVGFDQEALAVVVDTRGVETSSTGGLAKATGTGAAMLSVHGGRLAKKAGRHAVSAAIAAGKSLKSGSARKAIDKARAAAERWMDGDEDE